MTGLPGLTRESDKIRPLNTTTMIDKLQFISNQTQGLTHLESIKLALDAGCRWVQLRVKGESPEEVRRIAADTKLLCDTYRAKLIINDFPLIAREVGAYGLHLGLDDMPITSAREIVGKQVIIGGTANTLQDVLNRVREGADYVGLGPFRFTSTKQNLSPVLGLEGYQDLLNALKEQGLSIPVIAIGGITDEDIPPLIKTGIYGVALSGSLISAANRKEMVHKINKTVC